MLSYRPSQDRDFLTGLSFPAMLRRNMKAYSLLSALVVSLVLAPRAANAGGLLAADTPTFLEKSFAYVAGSTRGEERAFPIYGCHLRVKNERGAWILEVSTPEGLVWRWSEPLSLPLREGPWPTFEVGAHIDYSDGWLRYSRVQGSEFFEPRELRLEFQVDPNFRIWKNVVVREWRTTGFPRRVREEWTRLECLDSALIER
jgi:hypothetical protein